MSVWLQNASHINSSGPLNSTVKSLMLPPGSKGLSFEICRITDTIRGLEYQVNHGLHLNINRIRSQLTDFNDANNYQQMLTTQLFIDRADWIVNTIQKDSEKAADESTATILGGITTLDNRISEAKTETGDIGQAFLQMIGVVREMSIAIYQQKEPSPRITYSDSDEDEDEEERSDGDEGSAIQRQPAESLNQNHTFRSSSTPSLQFTSASLQIESEKSLVPSLRTHGPDLEPPSNAQLEATKPPVSRAVESAGSDAGEDEGQEEQSDKKVDGMVQHQVPGALNPDPKVMQSPPNSAVSSQSNSDAHEPLNQVGDDRIIQPTAATPRNSSPSPHLNSDHPVLQRPSSPANPSKRPISASADILDISKRARGSGGDVASGAYSVEILVAQWISIPVGMPPTKKKGVDPLLRVRWASRPIIPF
jgi:hypothetical protein